ncbi:MAG: hypothetical protein ACJ8AW_40065 [Rhodopila sp.]
MSMRFRPGFAVIQGKFAVVQERLRQPVKPQRTPALIATADLPQLPGPARVPWPRQPTRASTSVVVRAAGQSGHRAKPTDLADARQAADRVADPAAPEPALTVADARWRIADAADTLEAAKAAETTLGARLPAAAQALHHAE